MTSERHRSISRAEQWTCHRPHSDPSLRHMKHGRIRSMDEDRGLLRRLLDLFEA